MADTKMLQAILDGQKYIRDDIKNLEKKTEKGFKEVNSRLDKQDESLAYLEDDAPTIVVFYDLETKSRTFGFEAIAVSGI